MILFVFFQKLRNLRNKLYSKYCCSLFGSCGVQPRIYYPLALWNPQYVFIGNHCEIRPFCQINIHTCYTYLGG